MIQRTLHFAVIIFFISSITSCTTPDNTLNPNLGISTNQSFSPSFNITPETTHSIPSDQNYTFGYLEVLENRNEPNSRTIQVPVYIFKSRNPDPKPDPIIYTVGGPGASTMPSAQYMKFYKYLDDRDFILIEQRGARYSKPHLDCPGWTDSVKEETLLNSTGTPEKSILTDLARSCRERLLHSGIDLNGYRTTEIAADIMDLVSVLDIDQYNLLTISYSTKIAQVLMRDNPEKIRSVVMDSSLPLSVSYDEESVSNLLKTVELILDDCENDEVCNSNFTKIKSRFFNYLTSKSIDPIELPILNPENNETTNLILSGAELINIFSVSQSYPENEFPYQINKLLNNDLSSIQSYFSNYFSSSSTSYSMGMRLSVWCAEEYPFNNQEKIKSESNAYPEILGLSPALFRSEICDTWDVIAEPEIENEAIQSEVPVLLINGGYDSQTPSHWAKSMQQSLSNSYHLEFKGWGHTPTTNWGSQCAMVAANEFFNNPSKEPSPSCFINQISPPFKVD